MPITVKETTFIEWGLDPFVEIFCPTCGSSITDLRSIWPKTCWHCQSALPKMYAYLKTRKMARLVYYADKKGIG